MQLVPTEFPSLTRLFKLLTFGLVWLLQPQLDQYMYIFSLGTVMETSNCCQFGTLISPNNLLCILTVMWVGLHRSCRVHPNSTGMAFSKLLAPQNLDDLLDESKQTPPTAVHVFRKCEFMKINWQQSFWVFCWCSKCQSCAMEAPLLAIKSSHWVSRLLWELHESLPGLVECCLTK